jgi:hypothetical protein
VVIKSYAACLLLPSGRARSNINVDWKRIILSKNVVRLFQRLAIFFVSLIEEVILLMWTPGLLNPSQFHRLKYSTTQLGKDVIPMLLFLFVFQ